ncbi:MAG: hypothetical protein ABIY70_00480 [Capsulimonas sp.]|uniref:hypothetical protein n=1 Tax=Capsulimonas sp. TaxID=2494211 RepID=UPI0032633CD0
MCNFNESLDHNELSAAFLIEFGDSRILLGGDVTKNTWQSIFDNQDNNHVDFTNIVFVKISHHGSSNGYCDELWPNLSQTNRPLAGFTPYRRMLPQDAAIKHIDKHAGAIVATGMPHRGTAPQTMEFPAGTPELVKSMTKGIAKSARPISHAGSFSISVNAHGNITGPDLMGSAVSLQQ